MGVDFYIERVKMKEKDGTEKPSASGDYQGVTNDGHVRKVGIWRQFKEHIHELAIYQIFIARGLKNKRSWVPNLFLTFSTIFFLAGTAGFNHVYKLEEMDVLEGVYLKWTKPKYGSRVFVKAEDGRVVKFHLASLRLSEEKRLNMLVGEKIKCFFAYRYRPLPPWPEIHLFEIDYNGEKIRNYNYDLVYQRVIFQRWVTCFMPFISLCSLVVIYYQNKQ